MDVRPFQVEVVDTDPEEIDCARCQGTGLRGDEWCRACKGCGADWLDCSRLWCLGHNLDVAAALTAMAELSWRKGFDAGTILANLSHEFEANAAE